MIEKLTDLLRRIARYLEEPASPTMSPDTVLEEPAEQPTTNAQTAPTTTQAADTPPPRFWQRTISAERARLRWLWGHPWVIVIAIGLAIAIVVAERWLIRAWQWLVSQIRLYWLDLAGHPVALVGVGIVLLYLLFGLQWLHYIDDFVRGVWRSIKGHPRLSAFVGGVLLLIGLWIANNHGTWVVLPFKVGQIETQSLKDELNAEKVAIHLIAELNQVGVGNPIPVLILWEPQEPRTATGNVTSLHPNLSQEEWLEGCDMVLWGPGDFIPFQRIPLPRVLTGSQGSRLDLGNLSIGAINIPSQIFTQFILKILPTGYREFNGQINESNGVLEVSVSSRNPSHAWYVAGPSDAFPEMMEYLALRMALDLNPDVVKSSGLDTPPSDRDLALAMGNQAFRQQRYQRAWAFFELADRFAPLDEKVDAMLSLTHYHQALAQPGDAPSRFNTALQAMEAAVREDPNGDSSLLRPYLACLYHKAGREAQASDEFYRFREYLSRLESRDREARVEALKQLPLRGPGRHLSVAGDDILFVDEAGDIKRVVSQTGEVTTTLKLSDKNPRQIGTYGDSNLLFITPDGEVRTYAYQATEEEPTPKTLIIGRRLKGVQQISTSASQFRRINLFFLNRFGAIYWCDPNARTRSASACPPQLQKPLVTEPTNVRQIFSDKDRLYMLAADGAVWYTEVNVNGQAPTPRQLTPPAQVQEIFVASDETLYLLHDNGNVWRYYDDGRAETEDLKLIDGGTGTAQIFAAGGYLYLLKSDGAMWRISNPRNPDPDNDLTKIESSIPPESATILENTTIQEMFVTAEDLEGDDISGDRTVYLLTDQRVLLRGTDTGSARTALSRIDIPALTQTSASQ
jgi:tetratricopeptide (TPR) repeat protein